MNFVAAILYGVSTSTLVALLLAFARGGLNPGAATLALGCGLLVVSLSLWRDRKSFTPQRAPSAPEWLAIVAFVLVSARIFLWVVFTDADKIEFLSENNLGDLSLHLTYVRYLASGVPFWPDNPILTGDKLTYPIGIDFFHSLLTLAGVNVLRGFVWIGLAGAALTGATLWRWGRGFALFGFLANGGIAGFAIFSFLTTFHIDVHQGQWLFQRAPGLADFQAKLAWKSLALALFATQRGLLFALPAGLLLMCSWRTRFFGGPAAEWRLPFWGELLLYASMPLYHFHTFLFLSVLLGAWIVFHGPARGRVALLVGAAFVPATLLVLLVTDRFHSGHGLGWKPGWMWDDAEFLTWCGAHLRQSSLAIAAVSFWPVNFGILPLMVAVLVAVLCRRGRSAWARLVVFPALGLFLVCCFVKFARWEWDNTKLMIWSYLAILPFLWSEVLAWWRPWPRRAVVGLLFFSGFVSTLGGIDGKYTGYALATRSELDGVAYAVRGIPVTERFAGAPIYNHPLLLNGRKMVLGYVGHVESHGLDWQETANQLDTLMNGEGDWRATAVTLGARYLFWGRNENEKYDGSPQPWRETTRLVATGEWGAIYDLQSPPAQPPGLLFEE
jgi:hypothetical protein